MSLEIIGNKDLLRIENVENMLRAVITKNMPQQINASSVNWRECAEQAIARAKKEAAKHGGSIAFAESLNNTIFNWAVETRIRLISAAQ